MTPLYGLPVADVARLFDEGITTPEGSIPLHFEVWTGAWFFRVPGNTAGVDVFVTPNWQGEPGLTVQVSADPGTHRWVEVTTEPIRSADALNAALLGAWDEILEAVFDAMEEAERDGGAA